LLADGDVELTVLTSTASVWSPVVPTLDSYLCYGAAATRGASPLAPSPGHLLTDAFETRRFDLVKPGAVCLAAARNGAPITDATTALQAAAIKAGKVCSDTGLACRSKKECAAGATCDAQPKFTGRSGVVVLNALFPLVVDVQQPKTVLLPSSTNASVAANPLLDHFKCYATKPHTKVCVGDPTKDCDANAACGDAGPCFTGVPKDLTVRVEEPVATPAGKVFTVKKPTALCLPAGVDGAERHVPGVSLQCYAVAPAKGQCANAASAHAGARCTREEDCGGQKNVTSYCRPQAKHVPAVGLPLSNLLGASARDTKKESEVCVPSETVIR